MDPTEIADDHPLVEAVAAGQALASGKPAVLGSGERIGNFGDGNILAEAGIPTVQYGPGDIRLYPEWPAPDERVEVKELMITAKVIAHTALALCG
jgi:acetylornithine deacetylase/succinyl-diaminopimelate desuccinylase-like protein